MKKNVEKRDYLQISYAHDSRHFDCRSNCLLIMCSVYLNRGLTIYFIVFKGFYGAREVTFHSFYYCVLSQY